MVAETGAEQRRPQLGDMEEFMLLVSEGAALRDACRTMGLHAPSTNTFVLKDPVLREQYACARAMRGDDYGEKIANVVGLVLTKKIKPDMGRVAIDGYKWVAARMAPKEWGDKQQHEHMGEGGGPIQYAKLSREERQARIAELEARRRDRSGGA